MTGCSTRSPVFTGPDGLEVVYLRHGLQEARDLQTSVFRVHGQDLRLVHPANGGLRKS